MRLWSIYGFRRPHSSVVLLSYFLVSSNLIHSVNKAEKAQVIIRQAVVAAGCVLLNL